MSFKSLQFIIKSNLKNIPGQKLSDKFIVIECDDWGSQRMPSMEAFNTMKMAGLSIDDGRYNLLDTLESSQDLSDLFELLRRIKGSDGRPAVMTAFTNMANPDFDKIRDNFYMTYYFHDLDSSYKRYSDAGQMKAMWMQGIGEGVFIPQLHGREHIAVQFWLKELQNGNENVIIGFRNEFVFVKDSSIPPIIRGFRPELYSNEVGQLAFLRNSIEDACSIFEKYFGMKATAFAPSNGIINYTLEGDLVNSGIKYLASPLVPKVLTGKSETDGYLRSFGQKSKSGLYYYLRNCAFEPTAPEYQGIDATLKQVCAAFRWKKPAIISTHRVNFVGGLNSKNRSYGLAELKKLINGILKIWPEVRFVTTEELMKQVNSTL